MPAWKKVLETSKMTVGASTCTYTIIPLQTDCLIKASRLLKPEDGKEA